MAGIGHTVLLSGHVTAGVLALAFGPLALLGRSRKWHVRFGAAYQVSVMVLVVSALVLVSLDSARLWGFMLIAVATEAAAAAGWWLRRRRAQIWTPWQVSLLGGSYVSLLTALAVVNVGTLLAWIVPTAVGSAVVTAVATVVRRRAAVATPPIRESPLPLPTPIKR